VTVENHSENLQLSVGVSYRARGPTRVWFTRGRWGCCHARTHSWLWR